MQIECISRFFIIILSSLGFAFSSYIPIDSSHQLSDSFNPGGSSQYPLNIVVRFSANQGALHSSSQSDHLANSNVPDRSSSNHRRFSDREIDSRDSAVEGSHPVLESSLDRDSTNPDHDYLNGGIRESQASHSAQHFVDASSPPIESPSAHQFAHNWPGHVIRSSSSSSDASSPTSHHSSRIFSELLHTHQSNDDEAKASLFISPPHSQANHFDSASDLSATPLGHSLSTPAPAAPSTTLAHLTHSSVASSSSPPSELVAAGSATSETTINSDSEPGEQNTLSRATYLFSKWLRNLFSSQPEKANAENEIKLNASRGRILGEQKDGQEEDKDERPRNVGELDDDETKRLLFANEDAFKYKELEDKEDENNEKRDEKKDELKEDQKSYDEEKARKEEEEMLDEVDRLISSIRSQTKNDNDDDDDDDSGDTSSSSDDDHPKNNEQEQSDGSVKEDESSFKSRNNRNRLTVQMDYVEKLLNVYRTMHGMVNIRHIERGVSTPRLSVTSPIAVLRDALMEELRRKRIKEQQDRIKQNAKILEEIG